INLIQGSSEWLILRKSKITATDAPIIMGESPYKSKKELYLEKIDPNFELKSNDRMRRGTDLEPVARQMFILTTGVYVEPRVVLKEWAMASLDGIDETGKIIVEIKCPGIKDHEKALNGHVPDHYFAQLQHQMYVCDVDKSFYFS